MEKKITYIYVKNQSNFLLYNFFTIFSKMPFFVKWKTANTDFYQMQIEFSLQ